MLIASPSQPWSADPAWRGRLALTLLTLLLLGAMLQATEFHPWQLFDPQSLQATATFLASSISPAHDREFLHLLLNSAWQTVAIATAGVALAFVAGIPLALLGTRALSLSRLSGGRIQPLPIIVRGCARSLAILLRSMPELVWALLLVRIVGLGPLAGVGAIALSYSGMLGKVYADILENTEQHSSRNLLHNGCSRWQALCYGLLPHSLRELMSYTVYRWECALRGTIIMGFVGAGGLGQRMDESLKMLAGGEVASILLMFVLLTTCADLLSAALRKLIHTRPSSMHIFWLIALIVLIVASFGSLSLPDAPLLTAENFGFVQQFVCDFFPPEFQQNFLKRVAAATWETLSMSCVSTLIACCAGLLLALPASGRVGRWPKYATRLLLNLARSIPELVWAACLLILAGLGPFAGCLALAAHTSGVLGRLFADCLENSPRHAERNLRCNGASAWQAFWYATLPQALPQMLSYALYRWENNIRAAAVLGVVGAGGLGQMLKFHLSLFQLPAAATVILLMLLLITAVDAASIAIRRRMI